MADRESLETEVALALAALAREQEESQERWAKSQGMHPTDFRCLAFLSSAGKPVSARAITSYLGLTTGAGTALLDRLESAGLVRRLPNPDDRRSVLVELDRTAAAAPLALHDRIRAPYLEATTELSDSELAAVARFLARIVAISAQVNEGLALRPDSTSALDGRGKASE